MSIIAMIVRERDALLATDSRLARWLIREAGEFSELIGGEEDPQREGNMTELKKELAKIAELAQQAKQHAGSFRQMHDANDEVREIALRLLAQPDGLDAATVALLRRTLNQSPSWHLWSDLEHAFGPEPEPRRPRDAAPK